MMAWVETLELRLNGARREQGTRWQGGVIQVSLAPFQTLTEQ
ncbi:MAG: hypothetical protein ACI89X_003507 [Planctomycetota bacterium]|jgi:hypothetical protein